MDFSLLNQQVRTPWAVLPFLEVEEFSDSHLSWDKAAMFKLKNRE